MVFVPEGKYTVAICIYLKRKECKGNKRKNDEKDTKSDLKLK